jgi:hypothetical protein
MERNRRNSFPARAAFLGAVVRFLEIEITGDGNGAILVARQQNEKRALDDLPNLAPDLGWSRIFFNWRVDRAGLTALRRQPLSVRRRLIRLGRLLLRRRLKYFQILRVIEMIGYYARYLEIFERSSFTLAVMSSHSNPHGIAFNLAARKHQIPVVLITHGMPVRPVAKLDYDLAVVHCEAARQIYLDAGCRMNAVLIHGRRQDYAKMPASSRKDDLKVGIFLCKDVNESVFQKLAASILNNSRVKRMIVRPHPKNLWLGLQKWIEEQNDDRITLSAGGPSSDDIEMCDIVLSGNSSVLVEAVTAGRPAGYVRHLDHGSDDMHDFVKRGLIYPIDDELIDSEEMLAFYQRSEWIDVLRLFANIDEDADGVNEKMVAVMRKIARKKPFQRKDAKEQSRKSF